MQTQVTNMTVFGDYSTWAWIWALHKGDGEALFQLPILEEKSLVSSFHEEITLNHQQNNRQHILFIKKAFLWLDVTLHHIFKELSENHIVFGQMNYFSFDGSILGPAAI